MLSVRHLSVTHLRDLKELIHDLSFTVSGTDRLAVIGEEGNGKSTLLKLIYDAQSVQSYCSHTGEIACPGEAPGYLSQEIPPESRDLPVYAWCAEHPAFLDISPKELNRLCAQLQLPPDICYADQPVASLSGGEKVKLRLLLALCGLTAGILAGVFGARASMGFGRNLRTAMYQNIQTFSFSNIDRYSPSGLVTRLTTDITNVQMAFMMLIRIAVRAPLMLIFSITMAFIMGGKLAGTFVFVIPILVCGLLLDFLLGDPAWLTHPVVLIGKLIDKLEKIGRENVTAELLDDGISEENIDKIFRLVSIKGSNDEILEQLKGLGIEDETFKEGVSELDQVVSNMRLLGMPEENFEIDLTIARGLDYYTGTVYETRLNDYPQFGSVCSGGRYENLTGFYSKTKMPGIGISIGLTRMFSQLKEAGLLKADTKTLVKALVVPMSSDQMKEALQTASVLRQAQIPTDVYYQQKGMKQKMKYASRLGIPYVVLIGEDEAKQGKVAVKDMTESTQTVVTALEAARLIAGKK